MPNAFGFQLNLELDKVPCIKPAIDTVAGSIIKLARDLRSSGSDLLTEEDLCLVFSRGRIDGKLAMHFKDCVKSGNKTPLHEDVILLLDSQPGPTLRRALINEYYLRTVVQLSFLCWFHERSTLAAALYECLTYRGSLGLPGTSADATYNGIEGTLRAISAETGKFPWALYVGLIETRLPNSIRKLRGRSYSKLLWEGLSSETLLATMDFLFIVQELPEERMLMCRNLHGFLPLIIWSHYILGLTVELQGCPDGNVKFGGSEKVNVIILWSPDLEPDTKDSLFVLDSGMEVVLQIPPDSPSATIWSQERIPVEGYLTTHLQRVWNTTALIENDHPAYSDCADLAASMAICMNARCCFNSMVSVVKESAQVPNWQIFEAAKVLMSGIDIRRTFVNKCVKQLQCKNPRGTRVTAGLRSLFESLYDCDDDESGVPESDDSSSSEESDNAETRRMSRGVMEHVIPCAILILVFAHIQNVSDCRTMPIVYGHNTNQFRDNFINQLSNWDGTAAIQISESDWLAQVAKLMVGRCLQRSEVAGLSPQGQEFFDFEHSFLISEYGWSVYLNTINNDDPAQIGLNTVRVQPGVPFNPKKEERKYRLLDMPHSQDSHPKIETVDKIGPYIPRCMSQISNAKEYYSIRSSEFYHCQRYDIDDTKHVASTSLHNKYTVSTFCRQLHRNLYSVLRTKACEHENKRLKKAALDMDSVTVKGLGCSRFVMGTDRAGFEERVCILLTCGNSRARRIVVSALYNGIGTPNFDRHVLLRGYDCCENCAVDQISTLPGRWLVIL